MGKALVLASLLAGIQQTVGDTALFIAALASGLAGMAYIYRKVFAPAAGAFRRTYDGVGVLEDMPAFMREMRDWRGSVDRRLEDGSTHMARLDAVLETLASSERAEVQAAIRASYSPPPVPVELKLVAD